MLKRKKPRMTSCKALMFSKPSPNKHLGRRERGMPCALWGYVVDVELPAVMEKLPCPAFGMWRVRPPHILAVWPAACRPRCTSRPFALLCFSVRGPLPGDVLILLWVEYQRAGPRSVRLITCIRVAVMKLTWCLDQDGRPGLNSVKRWVRLKLISGGGGRDAGTDAGVAHPLPHSILLSASPKNSCLVWLCQ